MQIGIKMTRTEDKAQELREKANWHLNKARKLLQRATNLDGIK